MDEEVAGKLELLRSDLAGLAEVGLVVERREAVAQRVDEGVDEVLHVCGVVARSLLRSNR